MNAKLESYFRLHYSLAGQSGHMAIPKLILNVRQDFGTANQIAAFSDYVTKLGE